VAEDVNLAAVILCGMRIVLHCTLYNQGAFGKQRTSWFCCYKSPGPKYKECLIKMFESRKEGKQESKQKASKKDKFQCSGYLYSR